LKDWYEVDNIQVLEFVRSRVTQARFEHSKRVADMAVRLAKAHGFSEENAYLAGILHDICREYPGEKLLELAEQYQITVDEYERVWPIGLHGKVAAEELRTWGLDEEVLEAIRYHVSGYPGMGSLARILYLADKIEEGRSYTGVEELRLLALKDLDGALSDAIDHSLLYLIRRKLPIHPNTLACRNELLLKNVLPKGIK